MATTLPYIRQLFHYDDWANGELVDSLSKLEMRPARSVKLLSHILAAKRLWLERLQEKPQTLPVWPEFDIEQCRREAQDSSQLWTAYLSGLNDDDLARSVTYKNTKGENWESKVGDVLTHVVLHSAYHRGQIAADMRASGTTPVYTDFIHAVRQKFVQ